MEQPSPGACSTRHIPASSVQTRQCRAPPPGTHAAADKYQLCNGDDRGDGDGDDDDDVDDDNTAAAAADDDDDDDGDDDDEYSGE